MVMLEVPPGSLAPLDPAMVVPRDTDCGTGRGWLVSEVLRVEGCGARGAAGAW